MTDAGLKVKVGTGRKEWVSGRSWQGSRREPSKQNLEVWNDLAGSGAGTVGEVGWGVVLRVEQVRRWGQARLPLCAAGSTDHRSLCAQAPSPRPASPGKFHTTRLCEYRQYKVWLGVAHGATMAAGEGLL